MSLLIIAGICLVLFLPTPQGRAIGLSMILLGFSVIFFAHFSEERAGVYQQHIVSYLK